MDWARALSADYFSVPDRLALDLERLILDGAIVSGEKLPPERELAQQLGVSRASVREALHVLAEKGLVSRKQGRGTTVIAPGESQSPEGDALMGAMRSIEGREATNERIMELREILEPPIAGIAAARASKRDVEQLRRLASEMERTDDVEAYAALDRKFHQAIAQYSHNPLLALLNEQIALLIEPIRDVSLFTVERQRTSSIAHRRIFEAIAAQDSAAAEREARDHVSAVRDEIIGGAASLPPGGERRSARSRRE